MSVEAGKTFELHCRAQGHPDPTLSWQKDGGTSFPAANDRRMDFQPASKVYVIKNAQYEDTGKYTCSATNEAGSVNATAFVTVLSKRAFFYNFHLNGIDSKGKATLHRLPKEVLLISFHLGWCNLGLRQQIQKLELPCISQ